jgi:acetyltransferase
MHALSAVARTEAGTVWQLPGARAVRVRPVQPLDAAGEQAFFSGLSLDSRHLRFHFGLRELSPRLLAQFTELDPDWHRAWVAETLEPLPRIVADARFVRLRDRPDQAEFAIAVADDWQGRSLGRRLIGLLMHEARTQGLDRLFGDVLVENHRMLALLRDLGAEHHGHADGPQLVRSVLRLQASRPEADPRASTP